MNPLSSALILAVLGGAASGAAARAADAPAPHDAIYEMAEARKARMLRDAQPAREDAIGVATPCVGGMAGPFPCHNIDLLSLLPTSAIGGGSGNDIWGWTDPQTGKEYALMGRTNGTAFVDISDPENPVYLANLPTQTSSITWRDIKTYADHAFIVSEASGHGMQVFDLTRLRTIAAPPQTVSADAVYSGFSSAHNIVINEDSGFAYGVGTNNCAGGLHMVNIATPASPQFAGCVSSDGYTHDAQCVNYIGPDPDYQGREICFNANEDTLTLFDVTDKSNPVQISRTGYAGSAYTHQGWLTEDHRHFLLDDELDELTSGNNTRTRIWDVTNLDAPVIIGIDDATTPAIDHNQYIHDGKVYQANYRAGLRVFDGADIANGNITEIGYFDVYPQNDSASFNGAWSVYPFFASGTLIVSGIEQGLFILKMTDGGAAFELLPTAPGIAGQANSWTTLNGTAGTGQLFYFGFAAGSGAVTVGPCAGVTLGLNNPRPLRFGVADAGGSATVSRVIPAVLAGATLRFQAIDLGTCDTSNVTATRF